MTASAAGAIAVPGADALGLIQSGNIVMVRGIAGNENDVVLHNHAIADLKNCPHIHVAETLYGNWGQGTAKTAVSQYIPSHPQPLAGVTQDGGMMADVIQAFESTRAKVPLIADGECGGDLSWWLTHKDTCKMVAGCFNGFQGSYTYFDVTLRVLDNKRSKYNVLETPTAAITNDNLAEFAKPGLPLNSTGDVGGLVTAWCDDTCLDNYFNVTGTASASTPRAQTISHRQRGHGAILSEPFPTWLGRVKLQCVDCLGEFPGASTAVAQSAEDFQTFGRYLLFLRVFGVRAGTAACFLGL